MFDQILNLYNWVSAANGYIIGFIYHHDLYYIKLKHLPREILREGRTSSKRGKCLQIQIYIPAMIKREWVLSKKAIYFGSEELLNLLPYNRGHNFECLIYERFTHKKWTYNTTPFYESGDMRYRGQEIQIKFEGAELTNQKKMEKIARQILDI